MISHSDNPVSTLICPITLELMEKAVSVVVDGKLISYDKKALETWFEKNNGKKIDPKSNKEIEAGPFDNIELQNLIDEYKSKLIPDNNKKKESDNESGISFEFDHDGKPKKTIFSAVSNQPNEHVKVEIGNTYSSDKEVQLEAMRKNFGELNKMIRSGQTIVYRASANGKNSRATLSMFNVYSPKKTNDNNPSITLSVNNINNSKK